MTQAQIDMVFESEILRVTGGDASRIAWHNAKFDPPADGLWYSYSIIPAKVRVPDLAERARIFAGILQINVCAPAGVGITEARIRAGEVAKDLAPELAAGDVTLYTTPATVYAGIPDAAHYIIPVSADYRADYF